MDFSRGINNDDDEDFICSKNASNFSRTFTEHHSNSDICRICSKDLTSLNETRRLQHVNRCLDIGEQKSKFVKAKVSYDASIDCPLCSVHLPPGPFRITHLKKCCSENQISISQILQLVQTQEKIASMKRSKNLPHTKTAAPTLKAFEPKKAKNKLIPKSVADEQVQLAKMLSISERPDVATVTKFTGVSLPCSNKQPKKIIESKPLQTATKTEQLENLQDRLFAVISSSLCATSQKQPQPGGSEEKIEVAQKAALWNLHFSDSVVSKDLFRLVHMECNSTLTAVEDETSEVSNEIHVEVDSEQYFCNAKTPEQELIVLENAACCSNSNSKIAVSEETDVISICSNESADMFDRAALSSDFNFNCDNGNSDDDVVLIDSESDQNVAMTKCRTFDNNLSLIQTCDSGVNGDEELYVRSVYKNVTDEDYSNDLEKPLFERIKTKSSVFEKKNDARVSPSSFSDNAALDDNQTVADRPDWSKDDSLLFSVNVDQSFQQTDEFVLNTRTQSAVNCATTEKTILNKSVVSDDNTFTILKRGNVTPMPEYEKLGTPDLKQELGKYGVRPLARRRAVPLLRKIYSETHPFVDEEGCLIVKEDESLGNKRKRQQNSNPKRLSCSQPIAKSSSTKCDKEVLKKAPKNKKEERQVSLSQETKTIESDGNESDCDPIAEESFIPEELDTEPEEKDVNERLLEYFKSEDVLYRKVLKYEPLPLKDMHAKIKSAGIKCSLKCFLDFLDAQCITFTMKDERKKPGVRYKTPKKRRIKAC